MTVAGGGRVQEPLLVTEDTAANLLAEQEAHFLATMDAAQVGIFVVQDRLFKYVNPCFLRLFGFTAEELVDRKGPLDLIIPEQHPFVPRASAATITS